VKKLRSEMRDDRSLKPVMISDELYRQIVTLMPIPCVDLLVENDIGEVLLLRRLNEPERDEWWFPGGRVLLGETRKQAAVRKLGEECGLNAIEIHDFGTYDIFFPRIDPGASRHGITTLFHTRVRASEEVRLDRQSSGSSWQSPASWLKMAIPQFVRERLRAFDAKVGRMKFIGSNG
jgi:colanic acid biosynthesis protein WcaH